MPNGTRYRLQRGGPIAALAHLVGALSLLLLAGCDLIYMAEPIEAWVVDTQTHEPLEGVVVTANWQLKGGLEGGNDAGQVMAPTAVGYDISNSLFTAAFTRSNARQA